MRLLVILLLFISCKQQQPNAQRALMIQVADSLIRKSIPLSQDFIDKVIAARLNSLVGADSLLRKSIDSLNKNTNTLKTMVIRQNDSLTKLKNRAVIPSPADFVIDAEKGILYIKKTGQ